MTDITFTVADRIRAFADAVRAELDDLSAEELDDLVGGLEGDLTDQAEDRGGEIDLDDPAAYARELRAAAGLPEKSATPTREPLRRRIADSGRRMLSRIRSSRFGAWLLDLLIALRPAWWVLRGIALYAVIAMLAFPTDVRSFSPMRIALLLAVVLVSVQWGRGRWLPKNWLRHIRTLVSVVAILALPFVWAMATTPQYIQIDDGMPENGLLFDGTQIGNLFVYDANGDPVPGAQIFTDDGTPLDIFGEQSTSMDDGPYWWDGVNDVAVPQRDARGRAVWNIYPLQLAPVDPATGQADADRAKDPQPPFLRAPDRGIEPSPTPTPEPTPEPTPTP